MGLWKRFLSLFKPSSSAQLPKMSVIPMAPTDVTQWQTLLVEAVTNGIWRLADVETMQVYKLELWKRPKSPFHEFMIAYISRGPSEDLCILIDRTRTADGGAPSSGSQPKSMITSIGRGTVYSATSQSTPRDSLEVASSLSDSFTSKALDQFHRIKTPENSFIDHRRCHLLKTSHFHHGHQPNITELISAAHTLSRSEEYYKLLRTQCYWFSGSLFIYLVRSVETPPDIHCEDAAELDALTNGLLDEAKGAGMKEGHFKWITIFNSETTDVSGLRSPVLECLYGLRELLRKGEEIRVSRLPQEIKDAQDAARDAQEAAKVAESNSRMDRDARAKAESDARADREAKAKAESDARADREAKAKAESDARADREARDRAEDEKARLRERIAKLEAAAMLHSAHPAS